jgi:AcrR family transcriptional regulator
MKAPEKIKNQIMEAADARFRQYGFNKTTISEIAKDCDMSAANIYRFFKSKNDIIAEMAKSCFREKEDFLREVIHRTEMTAAERLKAFILEILRITHARSCNQPKVSEVVEFISCERSDLATRHKEIKQSLIAEMLSEGNRNGEFDVKDILTTAEAILNATVLSEDPLIMSKYSLEELERIIKGIVQLLVRGLKK